jgi:hypothetical protein
MNIRIVNVLKIAWIPVAVSWLGALLNFLVVRANGGMPALNLDFAYGKWVPFTAETRLPYLSDVIPLFAFRCSVGDVLMYLGTLVWICIATKYLAIAIRQAGSEKLGWQTKNYGGQPTRR